MKQCLFLLLSAFVYALFAYIIINYYLKYYMAQMQSSPHPIYVRSALGRALLEKIENDRTLNDIDRAKWYRIDRSKLDGELVKHFIELDEDEETLKFYEKCESGQNAVIQLFHTLFKPFLSLFITQTSINGLLNRGSMFVLSTDHVKKLLDGTGVTRFNKLLDLGAGDGCVTDQLAPLASTTYVTEISPVMRWRLGSKRFQVLDIEEWRGERYDFICCLNLLDRCDQPLTLLSHIKSQLTLDGFLLIAMVFPYSPYVESNRNHEPSEVLLIDGETIEKQVNTLYKNVLRPAGFQLASFSRVPYLCDGDFYQTYYYLNDVIMLLKHTEQPLS